MEPIQNRMEPARFDLARDLATQRLLEDIERSGTLPPHVSALDATEVVGWWEDAGKHWQHLADIGRRIEETGANKQDAA